MKLELQEIKKLTNNIRLLYVEDNEGLRHNMEKLLSRVFDNIILAEDGEDGYEKFIKHKPKIIIADINMPNMNGFKMIKKVAAIDPECRVIILSAHDEKEHLHLAIKLGVFDYLQKPAKAPELLKSISDSLKSINEEENRCIFSNQMSTIFNYQNNMVAMMHEKDFLLCNQRFFEFFGVDTLEEFFEKNGDIDSLLLEHKGFLYSTPEERWFNTVEKNQGTLFHTKIKNHNNEYRHLILKSREVPDKDNYYIFSFDDITELNLMHIFDRDAVKSDLVQKDKEAITSLMQVVGDNSSELKIHNFYKGLTIVNNAVVSKIKNGQITLKMPYPQLKIIQLTKSMTITSEIFPHDVICRNIKEIDIDNQSVTIKEMGFVSQSVEDRKYIRLEPEQNHSCTLFYKNVKFEGNTHIVDISEVSIKVSINALPAGMTVGTEIKLSFNLNLNGMMLSITTDADIYRIDESAKDYYIVALFELNTQNRHKLKDYLASRQMALIREFKKSDVNFS